MPSSRRAYLAGIATGVAGLAGCVSTPGGSGGTDTATDSPTDTAADSTAERTLGDAYEGDGYSVTVTDAVARKSVLSYDAPDAFGVETAPEGHRYAFVGVEASGDELPPREAFRFVAGDETLEPAEVSRDVRRGFAPVMENRYEPASPNADGRGWVAFAVPERLEGSLRVTAASASWGVPESAATPFRDPVPEFEFDEVSVPDAVDADEPIPVAVSVRNVGDGDGTVRGALNHTGPRHGATAFTLDVAAGGRETWETVVDYHLADEVDTAVVQFELATSAGDVARQVTIRGGGTEIGTATGTGDTATSTAVSSFDVS
jgi:hypothetical protein